MNKERKGLNKVIIVGGGFSGVILSILLASNIGGENVLLIERNDRLLKKVLTTGNGQCNITNKNISLCKYHGNNTSFATNSLKEYGNDSLINYFKNLGIPILYDNDKAYPLSKQASSIVDALRFKLESLKVNVLLSSLVTGVKNDNGFIVTANGENFCGENLVICSGGKSAKFTGSDGSLYSVVEKLGHRITQLYPSLVQQKCNISQIKGLIGLKQKANVKVEINNQIIYSTIGDIMFTENGLSGNAIFEVSSYLAGNKNAKLIIDFCPNLNEEELYYLLKNKQENNSYLKLENLLSGIMNKKIGCGILRNVFSSNLDASVLDVDLKKLIYAVKNYKVDITGNLGFDNSQVTRGGVDTNFVDDKTLQSKLIKNLYFAGEILDIDGDCGGYNLQWAYSSANAVAKAIINKK